VGVVTEVLAPVGVTEAVAAARAALGGLPAGAGWALSAEEVTAAVRDVLALRAATEGLLCELLREADGRGLPGACGARDSAGWVAAVGGLGRAAARALTELAEVADPGAAAGPHRCPGVGAALRAGTLDRARAEVIVAALRGLPVELDRVEPELRARAEAWLVEQAATLDPRELAVAARRLHETLVGRVGAVDHDDPVEADRLAEQAEWDAYQRRAVTRRRDPSGLTRVGMLLPEDVAAALFSALDPLAAPRPTDDGVADERTAGQRYADAVEDLVGAALDAGRLPERGGERPHLSVTVSWETLQAGRARAGILDTGEPLSAAALRGLLCDAGVLPVVLGGSSQPLDAGRARRSFDRYQRNALLARDGGCAGLGCDPHPARTHGHHHTGWAEGGPTDLANAALLCPAWHRRVHLEGWQVRLAPNGHPELVPPAWIDPDRRPRQNHRFRSPPGAARTTPLRT
jgi:Domain of unknown function (DUF222)